MIDPDSTSYPCLAVIRAHGLEAQAQEVYDCGRAILEAYMGRPGSSPMIRRSNLPPAAVEHLAQNYARAAAQFGWA